MKRSDVTHFLRGFLMGTANIIPGASGGTVALILGIYRRLITAISHFDRQWIGLVVRRQLIAASEHVDLRFLVSLVLGIVAATIVFGRLIHTLLTEYEAGEYEGGTLAVFFGLIVASTILVAHRVSQWNITNSVLAILGGSVAYMIASASPGGNVIPVGLFYLFCCGAIAISAMILPGISGALILKLLGVYTQVTGYLKDFSDGAFSRDNILGVLVFVAGCAIGLLVFTKILRALLSRYYDLTLCTLCGFMAGSLRSLWPWNAKQAMSSPLYQQIILFLVLAMVGAIGVLLLERLAVVENVGDENENPAPNGSEQA